MASTKIIGYVLAALGLAGILLSKKLASMLSFLGSKALIYTIVAAVGLIAVSVVLIMTDSPSSKVPHVAEEVPIYEGVGKKRKIVGYRKSL